MKFHINFFLTLLILNQIGCASTLKGKYFQSAVAGAAAGAAYGSSLEKNKSANAALYGANAAAIALTAAILYWDPDEQSQINAEKLRKYQEFRTGEAIPFSIRSGGENLDSLPTSLKSKLQKPGWNLYRIDDWEAISDTEIVHKTELFKFSPLGIK